ncbi:MAG: hypothetical protein JG767_1769 [Deferribacteraceae bacterium]|jgi:hypothetical protein|nr:hypothetical protein [Deferribacteraceae bacterium]
MTDIMKWSLLLLLILTVSCTYKPDFVEDVSKTPRLLDIVNKDNIEIDSPDNFKKEFPKSKLMLDYIVHFKRAPYKKIISEEVKDFDYNNGLLTVLKPDKILTNLSGCREILVNNQFENIHLKGNLLSVENNNLYEIYDVYKCGKIFSIKKGQDNLIFDGDKILRYENRYFEVLNLDKSIRLSGNLFKKIVNAHIYSGKLYLIDAENNLVIVDVESRKMFPPTKVLAEQILFDDDIMYLLEEKKLTRINIDNMSMVGEISKSGYIVTENKVILFDNNTSEFLNNEYKLRKIVHNKESYFILSNDILYIYEPSREIYYKEIILKKFDPQGCKYGKIYRFTDINQETRFIDFEKYSLINMSDNFTCEDVLDFRNGVFYHKNKTAAFKIADIVNSSDNYIMLERKIDDNNTYFYFEIK